MKELRPYAHIGKFQCEETSNGKIRRSIDPVAIFDKAVHFELPVQRRNGGPLYEIDSLMREDEYVRLENDLEHEWEYEILDEVHSFIKSGDFTNEALRLKLLENIVTFFRKDVEVMGDIKMAPNSSSAKLRRSLLLLYRIIRIAVSTDFSGRFKTAVGPLGIEPNSKLPEEVPNWALMWDGNYINSNDKSAQDRVSSMLVYVRPRPDSRGGEIKKELNRLEQLDSLQHDLAIPKIRGHGREGFFAEYLKPYENVDSGRIPSDMIRLLDTITYVAEEADLLHLDVKPTNVGFDGNDNVILMDWEGAFSVEDPHKITADEILSSSHFTVAYMPTHLELAYGLGAGEFDVDEVSLFQVAATMVAVLFGRNNYVRELNRSGYDWKLPNNSIRTATAATFLNLWRYHGTIELPIGLARVLEGALNVGDGQLDINDALAHLSECTYSGCEKVNYDTYMQLTYGNNKV